MSASLSIIRLGNKCMLSYMGDLNDIAHALTQCALRNDDIAEAVTRAAVEVELKKQVDQKLIRMTQKPVTR